MHLATLLEADLASAGAVAAWATRETPLEEKKREHHTKQPGEFTMQRYVTRPATLGRRKFDLRLWTLVASLEPLSVYVLDVAFPRARRAAAAAAAARGPGPLPPPPAGRSPSSTTRAGTCPATRVRSRPSACTSS